VYCTISENIKVKAEAETSETRVLLRFLSYILGRGADCLIATTVLLIEGADERENLVEPGESMEDWDALERTESRG
jgi:hypothetical protein